MSTLTPENGLVISYDFLWHDEVRRGQEYGSKEHPCAIVLAGEIQTNGDREVFVCAISHSPPAADQLAVEIPYKVAKHLGLDDQQMWIKTHEVNIFTWAKDRLPYGLVKAPNGSFSYGIVPPALYEKMRDNVVENHKRGSLERIVRD